MILSSSNATLEADLESLLGPERISTNAADRTAYARDLWPRQQIRTRAGQAAPSPPGIIVWPNSTEEVARIVEYAHRNRVELVPYGAGSGVCGGIQPSRDAILLDLKRMRRVQSIDRDRLECVAQTGIIGQHLEDYLDERGFTLGHFPSSIYCSTLGGWLAGRSAGQCSGRYGKIEDMALALTCVDGTGNVMSGRVGDRDPALLPLIIGSEGTLAVITEATLRISPRPEQRVFAGYSFADVASGVHAIREMYQIGLRPAVARLYDPFNSMLARRGGIKGQKKTTTRRAQGPSFGVKLLARALRAPGALNRLINAVPSRRSGAMLVLVWESDPEIAIAEKAIAHSIAMQRGAEDLGEGPGQRWLNHRHSVSYRQSPIFAAGGFVDTMEVAATWSRLLPMYHAVRRALAHRVFVMAHFSHAYPDGASIYFTFAGSAADDSASLEVYDHTWRDALNAVIEAGGTISHHHGVGRSKAPMMQREQGAALDVVRALKRELDPRGILNPGTLIPDIRSESLPANGGSPAASDIVAIDDTSMIIHARGDTTLEAVEAALARQNLTLGFTATDRDLTIRKWIDAGAIGGRRSENDPVDQPVAGLELRLGNGRLLRIRPAPRRAVGPDLVSAIVGARGALGTIESAYLVARRNHATCMLTFLFGDRMRAESALAWMRGRAVRLAFASVQSAAEGAALFLHVAAPFGLEEAFLAVLRKCALEFGGSEVSRNDAPRAGAAPIVESEIVRRLARRLDATQQ